jgi:hypothetical protein
LDESEDEKSAHEDEKRTEGKERGGIGGLIKCFFSFVNNLRIKSKVRMKRRRIGFVTFQILTYLHTYTPT